MAHTVLTTSTATGTRQTSLIDGVFGIFTPDKGEQVLLEWVIKDQQSLKMVEKLGHEEMIRTEELSSF